MNSKYVLFGVFLAFGLLSGGIGAGFALNTYSFYQTAVETEGTVIEMVERRDSEGDVSYAPRVRFETNEREDITFTSSMSSNVFLHSVGDEVPVSYDPERPSRAKINTAANNLVAPLMFGIFGIIFGGIGVFGLVSVVRRKKEIAMLKQQGQKITARVTHVEHDTTYRVNGRHPYRIVAQAHDPSTNTVTQFRSEHIWFDPTEFAPAGKAVEVLIHPAKPGAHYMDTTFLPKLK